MSSAEDLIQMLLREKSFLEQLSDEKESDKHLIKEALFDAIQLINDLCDPNCPEDFKEVAKEEARRFREIYFQNY